ncbi:MAG: DUF1109 domain-containing protein [Acidobacteria bacterium]|nr:DUF1109 domain-containing protein [Acidobacteriota bacterium]
MNTHGLPDPLRRAIAGDLRPVEPLPLLWKRALGVAIVAVAVSAAVLASRALRPDLVVLSPWVGWGAAILEGLAGLLVIGLALRESVPGQALSRRTIGLAIGIGIAMNLIIVVATRIDVAPGVALWGPLTRGMMCSRHEVMFAFPAFLVTVYLVVRAFPLRPQVVGLLGGLGAGLAGDGINHLLCPVSSLYHVLVWHTGAMVVLMLFGWCGGELWMLIRDRKEEE